MIEFDFSAVPFAASHYRINSNNRTVFYRLIKGNWFYHHIDLGWHQTAYGNSLLRKSTFNLIEIPLRNQCNEKYLPLTDLYDSKGVLVPSRPSVNNDKHKENIISSAISKLNPEYGHVFHSRSKLFSTLVTYYIADCDVYHLGKDFELDGWYVNFDLLKHIDIVVCLMELSTIELVNVWYEDYRPQPPFKVGAVVDVITEDNVITKNCLIKKISKSVVATYDVIAGDGALMQVKFENTIAAMKKQIK